MTLVDVNLQHGVEHFYREEAAALDEKRFHDWLDLFSDDTHYWMPIRRTRTVDQLDKEFTAKDEMAYFDDDKKKLYVSRLRDAAWSLYQAGLVDRAIDSLIVACAIERAGVISDQPSEIPFVRGMFVKLIAIAQQRAAAMAPSGTEESDRLNG